MVENYTLDQDPCFTMVNSRYKFYISFENSICKDYITEKTYNALKLNTIPIVLGKPESEFNQIEPRLKTTKKRYQLSAGLNLETLNTILSGTDRI